jgi:hypothetical protein
VLSLSSLKTPTFTGGTSLPVYNLNTSGTFPSLSTVLGAPTVTAPGTKVGADRYLIGSNPQGGGASTASSFQSADGIEVILAPNSVYLFRTTSLDSAAQTVYSLNTWFEGDTDLP